MEHFEKILLGKKSYYNAYRAFNTARGSYEDPCDILHDAIVDQLENGGDWHKNVAKIRKKACRHNKIDNSYTPFRFKTRRPAGWNIRACKYFENVNDILSDNGYSIGHHAMNGGEKQFGVYSVDFYIPKYSIIVEYNEKHHYETRQRISRDNNRRLYLEKITDIPIIIIHDNKESEYECYKMIKQRISLYNKKLWYKN